MVKIGQLLVQMDDSDLRAQEKQSKATLASAEQNVNLAKINLEQAHEDFTRADSQYKEGNFFPNKTMIIAKMPLTPEGSIYDRFGSSNH